MVRIANSDCYVPQYGLHTWGASLSYGVVEGQIAGGSDRGPA